MNRTHDLKVAMPYIIRAAISSPPIEIVVLDYNSSDGLYEYVGKLETELSKATILTYARYTGREFYHMAHAWNMSVNLSVGKYIVIMGTDVLPHIDYFKVLREMITDGCIWIRPKLLAGIIACQKNEFVAAGGYDERFEFYGPEDNDLDERLARRGTKFGLLPAGLLEEIYTGKLDKVANYRIHSRREMKKVTVPVYEENKRNKALVVNDRRNWGLWI